MSAIAQACLLILNYNGQAHLKDCLDSALEAVGDVGAACPVVVVDNQSTENDAEVIRNKYPSVELIIAPKNDYLFSLNAVVKSRPEEIIIILNNDMYFDRHFVKPLLEHFRNPNIFAVSAQVLDWEGKTVVTAQSVGSFKNFWFYKKWVATDSEACLTLYAAGGAAAFRRSMFLELGGFKTLYRPAYCEDLDLSYRAWQRGWKVIYEPRSKMRHKIGATMNKTEGRERVTRIIYRNEVLFMVKNCRSFGFAIGFLFLYPWRILHHLCMGNISLAHGLWEAAPRLLEALMGRWKERSHHHQSDDIFLKNIREGIINHEK